MPMTERFTEAMAYAAELHNEQIRKGSRVPYIAHLLSVTALALEHGANEDEAIAALLHDAIEDQGGDATRQEIRRRFGDTITEIINGLTDSDVQPKPPWRERKEAYIAHLGSASPSVLLISACDKLHNATSILRDYRRIGEDLWPRFRGGKDGTLWYYRALVTTYHQYFQSPLVEELDQVVTELEALAASRQAGN
jgi:(p)ppGpp synthase/HD superfamily hydrolase